MALKTIYILERRLNKSRIAHLTNLATQSGIFIVADRVQDASIILTCDSTREEVDDYLLKKKLPASVPNDEVFPKIIDMAWFFQCIKDKKLFDTDKFELVSSRKSLGSFSGKKRVLTNSDIVDFKKNKLDGDDISTTVAKYACQGAAPLHHKNKELCDALELLELHAIYRGDKNADVRALAFRRGSASLKSCAFEIKNEKDLQNLPYVGLTNSTKAGHCRKVIMEILTEGFSEEVESVIHNEFFQTMKTFCGIFGVGPVTARKWYHDLNLRTLDDVKASKMNFTQDQLLGLQHYEDINTPVTINEANYVLTLVEKTCNSIDNNLTVTLSGGFRRGKSEGHDVDLIICQPESCKTKILTEIVSNLQEHFIYTDKKTSSSVNPKSEQYTTMDHFDKCFSIFKFQHQWLDSVTTTTKPWKAIRVDLVVVPEKQFSFALLGWTGTKHFEREIRRYARAEKRIVLTSHGMFSLDTKEPIFASSEKEIFQKLDLVYREPSERCF